MAKDLEALSDAEIERIAGEIYDNDAESAAFDEACKMYPGYRDGGEDLDNAHDHILARMMEEFNRSPKRQGVSEADKQRLRDELSDDIYAGLT